MNSRNGSSASDDAPVEAALTDYFNRIDRGQSFELTEIIAAHPGCESGLREFLGQERKLHEVVSVVSRPLAAPENLTGRTLGDFQLERVIGRGGMGVVWQAKQLSLGRTAAVKLLPAALCADSRHRARFQNEARILAQLEHANVVNVLAVGEDADTYYFAMQYVEGMTADELIQLWKENSSLHDAETARGLNTGDTTVAAPGKPADQRASGPLPRRVAPCGDRRERYRMCARIAAEVADGLAHAHACGVLHRDIKPSNILLDKNGTARLSDFGLARMCGDATLTATGAILGTLRYASPEQLGGTTAVDERSDVYSLGVTLWELVTCERLFMAENHNTVISQVLNVDAPRPSSFAANLPRDLETVITRAMAKEPHDRYASAEAFGDDLRRFLAGQGIHAKPISLGERAFRWANRNRVLVTTAVGTLIVLAVVTMLAGGLIFSANSRTAAALIASQDNEEKARQNAAAAEASERRTRDLLYVADMALAGAAWHKNEPAQVRLLLDRYATPKARADGSSEEDPRGFEWYFLDRQIRPQSELLFQNDKALYLVEFMPGGEQFFTAGMDSIVRWHDAKTGKVVRGLDTQQREVNCVSYNPSRMIFATAGDDGTVKIWDATSLALLQTIKLYEGICYYAKFFNDEAVITGGFGKGHRLLNARTGQIIREYPPPQTPKLPVGRWGLSTNAFVASGEKRFWTTERWDDSFVYQGLYDWNIETGKSQRLSDDILLSSVLVDHSRKFVFLTAGQKMRILNAKSGTELQSIQLGNGLHALAISPKEDRLVVGDSNGQIHIWNLDLSQPTEIVATETQETVSVHDGDVYSVEVAPDGKSLITVSRDGSVRRTHIDIHETAFRELQWLNDRLCAPIPGTNLVVATKPLGIYERTTGTLTKGLSKEHYTEVATNRDGTLIAAGSGTHIGVWNVATGQLMQRVNQKRRWTRTLDFSDDNSLIAVNSHDDVQERIDIADLATGKMKPITKPDTESKWILFCVDDGMVVWQNPPKIVCLNVADSTVRWETKPFERHVGAWALSPDRRLLLIADRRLLTLFDCATGKIVYEVPCEYSIKSLGFIDEGARFVTGGDQGQLSIWHAASGQQLFEVADVGRCIHSIYSLGDGFLALTWQLKDKAQSAEFRWLQF